MRGYVCTGSGVADYKNFLVGVRGGAAVMFGVGYQAWIGFVPDFDASDGWDMRHCVVPVCDYYSVVGLGGEVASLEVLGLDKPGSLAFWV